MAPFVGVSPEDLGPLADLASAFNLEAVFKIFVDIERPGGKSDNPLLNVKRKPSKVLFYIKSTRKARGENVPSVKALFRVLGDLFSSAGFEEAGAGFEKIGKEMTPSEDVPLARLIQNVKEYGIEGALISQERDLTGNSDEDIRVGNFILQWLDKRRMLNEEEFYAEDQERFKQLVESVFSWVKGPFGSHVSENEWIVNTQLQKVSKQENGSVFEMGGRYLHALSHFVFRPTSFEFTSNNEEEFLLKIAKEALKEVSKMNFYLTKNIQEDFIFRRRIKTEVHFFIYSFLLTTDYSRTKVSIEHINKGRKRDEHLVATIEVGVSSLKPILFSVVKDSELDINLYNYNFSGKTSQNNFNWSEEGKQRLPLVFVYREDILKLEEASIKETEKKSTNRTVKFTFEGGGRSVETIFSREGEPGQTPMHWSEGELILVPEIVSNTRNFVDKVNNLVGLVVLGIGEKSSEVPGPELLSDQSLPSLEDLITRRSLCLGAGFTSDKVSIDLVEALGLKEKPSVIDRAIQRLLELEGRPGHQGSDALLMENLCKFVDLSVILGAKLYSLPSKKPSNAYETVFSINTSLPVLALSLLDERKIPQPNEFLQLYTTRNSLCKALRFMFLYPSRQLRKDSFFHKELLEIFSSHNDRVSFEEEAVVSISHLPEGYSSSKSAYDKLLVLSLSLKKVAEFFVEASFSLIGEEGEKGVKINVSRHASAEVKSVKKVKVNTFIA